MEYCTGILRSPPQSRTVNSIVPTTTARITTIAIVAFNTLCPFTKDLYKATKSSGKRDTMLITSIIDIPLPTPLSVILSPSHIRRVEPAVRIATIITETLTLSRAAIVE